MCFAFTYMAVLREQGHYRPCRPSATAEAIAGDALRLTFTAAKFGVNQILNSMIRIWPAI